MLNIGKLQRNLTHAQHTPVAGPLLASPAKAIVSTAQSVAGVAVALFSFSVVLMTKLALPMFHIKNVDGKFVTNGGLKGFKRGLVDTHVISIILMLQSLLQVEKGLKGLASSVVNMATLGIAGQKFDQALHSKAKKA